MDNIGDVDIVVLRVPSTAGCWGPNADLYTVTEIQRHHLPETYVILHISVGKGKMGQNVFLFVINKIVILFLRAPPLLYTVQFICIFGPEPTSYTTRVSLYSIIIV